MNFFLFYNYWAYRMDISWFNYLKLKFSQYLIFNCQQDLVCNNEHDHMCEFSCGLLVSTRRQWNVHYNEFVCWKSVGPFLWIVTFFLHFILLCSNNGLFCHLARDSHDPFSRDNRKNSDHSIPFPLNVWTLTVNWNAEINMYEEGEK